MGLRASTIWPVRETLQPMIVGLMGLLLSMDPGAKDGMQDVWLEDMFLNYGKIYTTHTHNKYKIRQQI